MFFRRKSRPPPVQTPVPAPTQQEIALAKEPAFADKMMKLLTPPEQPAPSVPARYVPMNSRNGGIPWHGKPDHTYDYPYQPGHQPVD